MRICFVADRYPTEEYPVNTFLDQLVCEMADQGVECTVVAPYRPILDRIHKKNYNVSFCRERITPKGNVIKVYHPTYFWGFNKKIAGINLAEVHAKVFANAIDRVIRKQNIEFDAVYGHFIMPAGFAAAEIGRRYNKPAFVAYGESSFKIVSNNFSAVYVRSNLESIAGVVAVSGKNRDELIEHGVVDPQKIRVFPNAIDGSTFRVMDKHAIREKMGIADKDFVVAFVGHFIDRKGSKRLSNALTRFDDVKSLFVGAGPEEPTCPNILHKGRVPHSQIPEYLNAADVFVLPTLAEGCCNAIVEAMACGLPVVSSDLPFNDDILNDENSIRIDPHNVDEIADAIRVMKDVPEVRQKMADCAWKKAQELTIDKRAERIIHFIEAAQGCHS